MIDKDRTIELFNDWSELKYGMGIDVVLIVRLNEEDSSFLRPFEWQERINLFIKLKMNFSVGVFIRGELCGDEITIVDNNVRLSWSDINDELLFEDRLKDEWIRIIEFENMWN